MIKDAVRRLWVKVSILASLRQSLYSVDLPRLSTVLNKKESIGAVATHIVVILTKTYTPLVSPLSLSIYDKTAGKKR